MIQSSIVNPITLSSNESAISLPIDSLRTRSANCCGWLSHTQGSPNYKIIKGGIYEIQFTGTLTSATAGIVSIGIYNDGVLLPCTVSAQTLATAGDLVNLKTTNKIRVCCGADTTLTVSSVPSVIAGATLVPTATQIPIITSGNLSIKKLD